jgi:hypothetical protein
VKSRVFGISGRRRERVVKHASRRPPSDLAARSNPTRPPEAGRGSLWSAGGEQLRRTDADGSSIGAFEGSLIYLQRPDPRVQCRRRNAEPGRRARWSRHTTVGLRQGGFDEHLLIARESLVERTARWPRRRNLHRQPVVIDGKGAGFTENHRSLDDVLQLSPPARTSTGIDETPLRQYGCGPVEFTGTDNALYERHLLFDDIVPLTAAGTRERFEAGAWGWRLATKLTGSAWSQQLGSLRFTVGAARRLATSSRTASVSGTLPPSWKPTTPRRRSGTKRSPVIRRRFS